MAVEVSRKYDEALLEIMGPPELAQIPLEEEYKKKTGVTPEDIADLRRWLETQPHLPSKHITDLDLILAFHSCDCSTGVTKQVLDLHYTLRTLFTTYFKDRLFDARIRKTLNTTLLTPLPTRTKEGYALFYIRLLDYDPKNFSIGDILRSVTMIMDVWQYKEGTWPGFILLLDYEGTTLGHIAKYDLQNVQQCLYFLQEAMLVKLKGLFFINAPGFFDKVLMLLKPFMKNELMEILQIHTPGSTALKSLVPLDALPKECGGHNKSCHEYKDDVIAMLEAGESYLKNENLKRVTESLRPGKPKTITDIFGGVEGSFKKLDID